MTAMAKGKRNAGQLPGSFSFDSLADVEATITGTNTDIVEKDETLPLGGYVRGFADKPLPLGGYVRGFADKPPEENSGFMFAIHWQSGPVDREGGEAPNGAFVEDVLEVVARRLEFYQTTDRSRPANHCALKDVRQAIDTLRKDRALRRMEGVHGKNVETGEKA